MLLGRCCTAAEEMGAERGTGGCIGLEDLWGEPAGVVLCVPLLGLSAAAAEAAAVRWITAARRDSRSWAVSGGCGAAATATATAAGLCVADCSSLLAAARDCLACWARLMLPGLLGGVGILPVAPVVATPLLPRSGLLLGSLYRTGLLSHSAGHRCDLGGVIARSGERTWAFCET